MNALDCRQTDYRGAKLVTMNTRSHESFLEAKDITKYTKKLSLTLILRKTRCTLLDADFPRSKRHIWKTLIPTSKTGGVRHSRSVGDQTIQSSLSKTATCTNRRTWSFQEAPHTSEGRSEILFGSWNVPKVAKAVDLKLIHEGKTSIPRSGKLFIRLKKNVNCFFTHEALKSSYELV